MSNGNYLELSPEIQPQSGGSGSPRIDECRRLVAQRYYGEGYISKDDIDPGTGFMVDAVDPYYSHSEYFWTLDHENRVEATIRVITYPYHEGGEWRFPLQKAFDLTPYSQQYIDAFAALNPESIVEVSGLAERKQANEYASLDMYRRFWQHAKRSGYNLCLISADERLDKKLSTLFGSAIQQVGDSKMMMGSLTVPSILMPGNCVEAMSDIYEEKLLQESEQAAADYRSLFSYLIDGLEPTYFSDQEKQHMSRMNVAID